MFSEDRSVVAVFNGEIYNFADLRWELSRRGHRLTGAGDSECLVHLYEEFGDDMVHHLRGMFAFAVWDRNRRRLLLARDQVGKKPFFWCAEGDTLWFASEVAALVEGAPISRGIDPTALHHYLTYQYVPAPWSMFAGVRKLAPGSVLVWENGTYRTHRYWNLDSTPVEGLSEADVAEELRARLLEATRIRMVSERPVGAFLSGGSDSSAVVAAMAQQAGGTVRTFCIGFTEQQFDERPYARAVAEHYDTDHHEMVVTTEALSVLPTLVRHFGEPFADSSAIPSFYVAQMSSSQVTVVLNGDAWSYFRLVHQTRALNSHYHGRGGPLPQDLRM